MFDAAPAPPSPALQQDPAFFAALKACGQNPVMLQDGLIVLHRRIAGVPVAMLPRARPPMDLQYQLSAVGLHRVPLILSPERPCPLPRSVQICRARATTVINLMPDHDTRRAGLHPKWRNQLRRAEASDLNIIQGRFQHDHPLLNWEADQAKTRGYVNWPPPVTSAFAQAAPDQTLHITARLHGRQVAHMLFLLHGNRATYHIGFTTPPGRATHAHNLILWQATCWLAERGFVSLDTGLLHENVPRLNRFKLRAGAKPQMMGGTWLRWTPLARGSGP